MKAMMLSPLVVFVLLIMVEVEHVKKTHGLDETWICFNMLHANVVWKQKHLRSESLKNSSMGCKPLCKREQGQEIMHIL